MADQLGSVPINLSIEQALYIARSSTDIDPSIVRMLQAKNWETIIKIRDIPGYIMTREEFAVFNFHRASLGKPEPAWSVAAVARYWQCANQIP
ncbi:MAG: hypothetical protein M1814_001739 [Vezdaea aestivalis]|nr:MAG: hypothetical protein M1814_001739 [Vezdaea aestivalis]